MEYFQAMVATAKSDNETVAKRLKIVEEERMRKSTEALQNAQKRAREYERHQELLAKRRSEIREKLISKEYKKKQRFERNHSEVLIKEKERVDKYVQKEDEYKQQLQRLDEHKKSKKEIKEEWTKIKSEGIAENLERIKRVKVMIWCVIRLM